MQDGPWSSYAAPSSTSEAGPWSNYAQPEQADQKAPPPAAASVMLSVTNRRGKKISFQAPVDADDATIRRLAASATGETRYGKAQIVRQHPDAPDQSAPEISTAPDDTSAISGFVAGALKPVDKAAEWLSNTGVGKAIDNFGVSLGLPSAADANAEHDEWRRNNTRTGYQLLGNIAGTVPLSRLPGGPLVQGGASGAVLTDAHDAAGTAQDAALGAGGGYIGSKVLGGLGSVAKGVTNKGAKMLADAGIPMTLGQIGRAANNLPGRIAAGVEERLAGLPLIGDVVNNARDRGVTALNTALGNRILGNVGETLPKGTGAGHEMVDAVQSRLSARYNQLVPKLSGTIDRAFATDLTAARNLADQATRGDQFTKVIERVLGNRVQGARTGGKISGQMLKDAESELTRLYGKYKNAQGDEGLYGEAIDMARKALRDMVARANPQQGAELAALNRGWAQLKDLRTAIRTGTDAAKSTGVVTPGSALRVAARKGYRDPFLEAATDILPNRTPDSGTAGRAALLLGAGAAGGAATIDPREHPFLAGTLAATAALSTRQGQTALNKLAFGSRPAAVSALATPLNKLSRYAPQAVTPLLVQPQD